MSNHRDLFDDASLATLVSFEGKVLQRVGCHLFINLSDQNSPVQVIDRLMLKFTDGRTLSIGADENGECLTINNNVMEESRPGIPAEYADKIKVITVEATGTTMWKDAVGLLLKNVRLTKEDTGYRADSLVLDFGTEMREVTVSPLDGIVIDYFED